MLIIVAAILCLASCKAEQPGAPTRPAAEQTVSPAAPGPASSGGGGYGLKIDPQAATRRTILVVTAEGFALQDVPVIWQVNGMPESSAQPDRFDCSGSRRGDRILAVAVMNGREIRSNEVIVGNTPPELGNVGLKISTTPQGDSIAVSAAPSDADNDKVTVQYAWTVNNVHAGNGGTLTRALRRGDVVRLEVIAYDGQSYSEKVFMSETIANHLPVFVEHQDFSFSGGTIRYQARALDADGDQVSFSLDSPAEGMSIDRVSGNLVWKVPDTFHGDQTATIVADDGNMGTAQYTVTFTIRE